MKLLQNKSTGEIGCLVCSFGKTPEKITVVKYIDEKRGSKVWYYNSLAELNEEWEDYEEPKEYFWIASITGNIQSAEIGSGGRFEKYRKEIGNYFDTKEEAEKAVEKLKAWKRLKDKGARFKEWFWDKNYGTCIIIGDSEGSCIDDGDEQNKADLDLLFGDYY